jgi:hypothetical protein
VLKPSSTAHVAPHSPIRPRKGCRMPDLDEFCAEACHENPDECGRAQHECYATGPGPGYREQLNTGAIGGWHHDREVMLPPDTEEGTQG